MGGSRGITVVCVYRVSPGNEQEFERLLARHWRTLNEEGLVVGEAALVYRLAERDRSPVYVEVFQWAGEDAARSAHDNPKVQDVWKPMGELVEEREGRPPMEFLHGHPAELLADA